MKLGETYSKSQIDKLGNSLIFLCEKLGEPITKTHLLKLVFIIEEISVKRYGIPFFDLRFDLWKLGPVSKDLFVELTEEPNLLADYVAKTISKNGNTIIVPIKKFCDDEFNDIEVDLLSEISDRFKYCTANELVNFTHGRKSPWYQTAVQHGILELLESGKITTTDIQINLADSIADDEQKLSFYRAHKDFISLSKSLKS